ncbi:hypothetical protein K504DRAFT_524608 [Pleomassaria siparia CBS 279.74]|uniref:Zn(2)-C6 fungal-type domain-containing protein n=1 Tax=Pleomassaria siparia CBS 279.74 TaxID=1314801 RepID=A0A6G1KB52_9PLEO|nr:hypothetical protein K504DRAFT_524608 [Pleomassaria siparia CBS 279.74]
MSDNINVSQTSCIEADDKPADKGQHDEHVERVRKQKRSLRKGIHSCWECNHHKEKCPFNDGNVCTGCLRRGTRCVSQHYADNDAQATANTVNVTANATAATTRLQRIKDMAAQLISQIQSLISQRQSNPLYTPVTSSSPGPALRETLSQTAPAASTAHSVTGLARLLVLSQTLRGSLPCPQDIQLLRKASARHPVLSTIYITTSYATLHRDGIHPTDSVLREPPLVTFEPVLMAKYMLQLAAFLQEMQSITYPELGSLIEPAAALTERCANTAINLCNSDRLRLSWMAVQRAMLLVQTMGLHLVGNSHRRETPYFLDPSTTRAELPNLWFRFVHYDLQLSRMLGLLPGAADVTKNALSSYNMAVETPEGYLEQGYCHVMILALAQRSSDANPPDVKAKQALDHELQRAANGVPSH